MEHWIDTLSDMALFVEVARAGSFRLAASRLQVPVSTLSRRVAGLERRLELPLLIRTTRSLQLSPAAKPYFERCVEVLEAAAQAQEALEASRQRMARIRISVPVDLGVEVLGPLIADYAAQQPALGIDFDLSPSAKDLFRDPIDLVFRIGRPMDERVVARKIAEIHAGLFASPSFLRHHGTPTAPDDLNRTNCLGLQMAQGPAPWRVGHGSWNETPGRVVLTANSVALLRALAVQGHGVALLPLHMTEGLVRSGALQRVLPHESVRGWSLVALTATRAVPAQVKSLIAHIKDSMPASMKAQV